MPKYCGRPEKEYLTQLGIAVEVLPGKVDTQRNRCLAIRGKKREIS